MQSVTAKRPRYVEVTDELRRRVESGEYAVGERLPTETQLTEEFDVSLVGFLREGGLNIYTGASRVVV